MKFVLVRTTCLSLAAGFCTAVHAQSDDSIPFDYIRPREWTFSVGARMNNEGAKVKFGRLGSVPSTRGLNGNVRIYDNGAVLVDGLRLAESPEILDKQPEGEARKTTVAATVTDSTTPGYYYTQGVKTETVDGKTVVVTDENGNAVPIRTGRYLRYQEGLTRSWTYRDESQLRPDGTVAMSRYSAISDGASVEAEGDSGAGIELALGRSFGRIGKRFEWGVTGVIGVTDINVKSSGTVRSILHTATDYYSLNGASAPRDDQNNLIFSQPTFGEYEDPSTGMKYLNSDETTTRLVQDPTGSDVTYGSADVDGHWQIKGSYFLIRLGPNIRANLTERLALNASVGFAGAFLGTKYRVDERLVLDNVNAEIREIAEDEDSQFLAGFYGELTAEFWLTERTGVYAGATYENVGDYEQVLNGRTADVELSSGLGLRFGITTRF